MSERGSEAVVAMAIFPRWVQLYFDKSVPTLKAFSRALAPKYAALPSRPHQTPITEIFTTHQGCDQALWGHLPAYPLDPHDHQVGVEEAETNENRGRLT